MSVSPMHSNTDQLIIKTLGTMFVAKSAFDHDRLFDDFCAIMRSKLLLLKSELREFTIVKPLIGLFVISIMHNSVIKMDSCSRIKLMARVFFPSEVIAIGADVPTPHPRHGREIVITSAIFETKRPANAYCSPDLLAEPYPWEFDLEINDKLLLARLE